MKLSNQINRSKKEKSKEINRQFFEKIQRNIPLHFVSDCTGLKKWTRKKFFS